MTNVSNIAILGLSHDLGKSVVEALLNHNQKATILVEDPIYTQSLFDSKSSTDITLVQGDMDNHDAVAAVCEDAEIIIPLFALPYHEWDTTMTRWVNKIADLGVALNAKIIYPSTVTPYGQVPTSDQPVTEEYPKQPQYEVGQLQLAFENRLIRASNEGANLIILRFPHLYGDGVLNPVMQTLFTNILHNKHAIWYNDLDAKTDFLYVGDAGEILVQTALDASISDTTYHLTGPNPITPQDWIKQIQTIANTTTPIKVRPRWRVFLSSLFNNDWQYLLETFYLYQYPVIMSDDKITKILPSFNKTTHEIGISKTIQWYEYWNNQSQ